MQFVNRIGVAGISAAVVLCLAVATERADEGAEAFGNWLDGLRREARAAEISDGTLDAALAEVELIDRVIELDRNQPEFTMTFDDYLKRVVSDKRVRRGRDKLREHRALLAEVQKRYGVQPRFVVALWGVETDYGRITGGFRVVDSLATLAYDGRRSAFFRGELMDALRILDQGHIAPDAMFGSWAGAMGQTQFMPSSFLRFAVDHDGDSRRDIWDSTGDVLASAANYLAQSGWRGDLIWGRAVRLPDGIDPEIVASKKKRPLAEWQRLGVRRADGSDLPRASVNGRIVRPGDDEGPAFLVYDNYSVLLAWNRSDFFATSVGILSDRIAGREGG